MNSYFAGTALLFIVLLIAFVLLWGINKLAKFLYKKYKTEPPTISIKPLNITRMKTYGDYQKDKTALYPTDEEMKLIEWTKYKIVVPTEADKQELMDAFEHFHYSDIDTEYITVNQLAHEYLTEEREPGSRNNIIVNEVIYNLLNTTE